MISYLYGFILLIFPMLFSILRGNGLVAKYVDRGSMVTLVAAPVKRRTIAMTQMSALVSGIFLMVIYATGLELLIAQSGYPGELAVSELLKLNAGLLCLQLFIGSICFLASCIFSDTKYSIAFGAGVPALMYVFQMLANTGEKAEKIRYCTFLPSLTQMELQLGKAERFWEQPFYSLEPFCFLLGNFRFLQERSAYLISRNPLCLRSDDSKWNGTADPCGN